MHNTANVYLWGFAAEAEVREEFVEAIARQLDLE